MRPLVRRARAIWRVLGRSKQLDPDMQEEMRFHLQMEAERLAQAHGLDPEEARRQAFVRFGGVEKYKEEGREARALHAFSAWRDHLTTLEQVGAFRTAEHNFGAPNAPPEPIEAAEITASAFDLAQTPPLLGHYLLRSDEQIGARRRGVAQAMRMLTATVLSALYTGVQTTERPDRALLVRLQQVTTAAPGALGVGVLHVESGAGPR